MIEDQQLRDHAKQRGVPELQVRRDYELSHLIHGLESLSNLVFIGGTALNRTFLPDLRLSEDLDLHVLDGVVDEMVEGLIDQVRLDFPDLEVDRRQPIEDRITYQLRDGDVTLKLEAVHERREWQQLPNSTEPVRLYYGDLPETVDLVVPTRETFVAMKLSAYVDRYASRDLFDLQGLAHCGAFSTEALDLTHGMLGRSLAKEEFLRLLTEEEWQAELGHQTSSVGTPSDALHTVQHALSTVLGWES